MDTIPTKPTQLALLEDTLSIPGATIARRNLLIDRATKDEDLPAIGYRLIAVRGFSKWGLGALMGEMIGRAGLGEGTPNDTDLAATQAGHWADCAGIDPKERRELLGVATFYPPRERTRDLSWEHYREAMWGIADGLPNQLGRACDLLDEAVEKAWTVTALRRYIRASQATEQPSDKQQSHLDGYGCVFDFRRYAARELECIATYTPERAALLLADIGDEAIRFIEELRSIAAK